MSLWVNRKESRGRRALYLLGFPVELLLVAAGLVFGFVGYLLLRLV